MSSDYTLTQPKTQTRQREAWSYRKAFRKLIDAKIVVSSTSLTQFQ